MKKSYPNNQKKMIKKMIKYKYKQLGKENKHEIKRLPKRGNIRDS